jgi:hypothetical protein
MVANTASARNHLVIPTTISARSGRVVWVDDQGHVEARDNPFTGRIGLVSWLIGQGVDTVVKSS